MVTAAPKPSKRTPVRLSPFEQRLFSSAAAALTGATAGDCLADGVGQAHRIQDAALNQVKEWRTRVKADRMRRRRAARRRAERDAAIEAAEGKKR